MNGAINVLVRSVAILFVIYVAIIYVPIVKNHSIMFYVRIKNGSMIRVSKDVIFAEPKNIQVELVKTVKCEFVFIATKNQIEDSLYLEADSLGD